ncbi:MAG: hypothetical protein ACTMHX_01060, partial [Bifidobacterium mongoliense]
RSMAIAGSAPKVARIMNRHHVPAGGIAITAGLGLLGVVLNIVLPSEAFEIIMNLAGIGIAGTWSAILLTHLAFLKQVRQGKEVRPDYRMPGAPWTNYLSLTFFTLVVVSNLTSTSGRWTLSLFAAVVVAMVAGWYAVRGRISGDMFESIDLKDGDQTPAAADDGFPVEVAGSPEAAEVTGGERS